MAVVAFPARNKLAYPAGTLRGIDPAHPAAKQVGYSGVSTPGGTFCNVLTPAKGTEGGTKTSSIYGQLGPVTNYVAPSADSTVFPFVSSQTVTLGGVLKMAAIPPNSAYVLNVAAAGDFGIGDATATGTFNIFSVDNTTSSVLTDTGVTYVLGAPYFFAVSLSSALMTWVVRRLDTGAMRSASVAAGANPNLITGDGTITVGSRGTNQRQLNGGIAAAMASNAFMSETQLRKWAEDPWAFWYPPQASSLVAAAAATPTTVLYQLMNVG